MRTLHLRLLGGFDARVDDAALSVGPRKARALLAHLALSGPRPVRRDAVATLLWGRTAQRQAMASLNQALHVLRKAFDAADCRVLQGDAETIGLDPASLETDVEAFARLTGAPDPGAWGAALTLYRGPLLDGLAVDEPGFETWLAAERMRLSDRAAAAGARLLEAWADDPGEDPTAVAQTLLAIDPVDEAAIRALMRADARAGRPARALARFDALRRTLHGELAVAPTAATAALADAIRGGELATAPTPRREAPLLPLPPSGEARRRRRRSAAAIVGGITVAAVLVVAVLVSPTWLDRGAPPASTPRLLVAPLTGDDARLSGLGADLATELSRLRTLSVLARETARTRHDWPPEAVRAVGATHLLAGSVRRDPEGITLTLRLVDSEAGTETWARRYPLGEGSLLAVRERVIDDVSGALALALAPAETPPTRDPAAYEAYLEGLARFHDGTPEGNAAAVALLEAALARDPGFVPARAWLAAAYLRAADGAAAYADALELHWSEAWLSAKVHLAALEGASDATALALEARLALRRHDLAGAVARAREAIALAPSHADAHRALAEAAAYGGDGETARAAARRALSLDPAQPAGAWRALALAAIADGAFAEARTLLERALAGSGSQQAESLALLAAVEGLLGDTAEAGARLRAYAAAREDRPRRLWRVATPTGGNPRSLTWARPTLVATLARHPFTDPATSRRLSDGWIAAGIAGATTGYPPLDAASRLDGAALRTVLFGASVVGRPADGATPRWRERRGVAQAPTLVGDRLPAPAARPLRSEVRDDQICDVFLAGDREVTRCGAVYALPNDTVAPGDYALQDELGLHFLALEQP